MNYCKEDLKNLKICESPFHIMVSNPIWNWQFKVSDDVSVKELWILQYLKEMEKRSCIHVLLFLLPTSCTVFSQWEMAQLEIYKVRKFQTYLWNTSFAMIASTNNGLLFCLMNNVWVAGTIFFCIKVHVHLCEVCFACDGFSLVLFQEV